MQHIVAYCIDIILIIMLNMVNQPFRQQTIQIMFYRFAIGKTLTAIIQTLHKEFVNTTMRW
ncbi:Uncharacterised protein [Mycobacteroides abscessus subsp. abscessus]|nr:Uncharacterised protein [Mycobacteroides abscessus subsp. abscessus]